MISSTLRCRCFSSTKSRTNIPVLLPITARSLFLVIKPVRHNTALTSDDGKDSARSSNCLITRSVSSKFAPEGSVTPTKNIGNSSEANRFTGIKPLATKPILPPIVMNTKIKTKYRQRSTHFSILE